MIKKGNLTKKRKGTYKVSRAARPMNDEVRHISDEVCCQTQIKQHVENIKQHLPRILGMQIAVSGCRQRRNGPVYRCHVPNPQALCSEIRHHRSNPCSSSIRISICN